MADDSDTLTLDEAASIDLADDTSAGQLVPQEQYAAPEPDYMDEGELDQWSSDDGLTLDEAAQIELVDDAEVKQIASAERPVAILEGHPLTLSELVNGFVSGHRLRQHAELLATQFLDVEDAAERVAGAAWSLAGLISQQLPPMPDDRLLALNPSEYARRRAVYDEAQAVVENVLNQGEQARYASGVMAGQRHGATIQGEFQKLVENFPNCATEGGRESFLDNVRDAVYSCDFTEDDMRQAVDHRLFRLAHLASMGLQALEQQNKPRPKKRRRRRSRSEAMERLERTGSIDDALAVDF